MLFVFPVGWLPRLTSGEDPGIQGDLLGRMKIGVRPPVFLSVLGTPASLVGGLEGRGISGKAEEGLKPCAPWRV